jgi:hypothetical protein
MHAAENHAAGSALYWLFERSGFPKKPQFTLFTIARRRERELWRASGALSSIRLPTAKSWSAIAFRPLAMYAIMAMGFERKI